LQSYEDFHCIAALSHYSALNYAKKSIFTNLRNNPANVAPETSEFDKNQNFTEEHNLFDNFCHQQVTYKKSLYQTLEQTYIITRAFLHYPPQNALKRLHTETNVKDLNILLRPEIIIILNHNSI